MYLVWSQDLRGFKFFVSPIGWVICGLLIVPWFALAVRQYPPMLDNLLLHHFGRFSGNMGAHEPWYAYLYLMPMLLLPWTPLAMWEIYRAARDGAFLLPIYRFLVCWVAPGLVLLSLSAFKAKHYTVPLLPPFVMLAAIGAAQYLAWRRNTVTLHSRWLWGATAAGVVAALVAIGIAAPRGAAGIMIGTLTFGAGLAAMIEMERRRRADWVVRVAFGTVWGTMVCVAWLVLPEYDSYRPLAQMAQRVDERVPDAAPLLMYRLPDNAMTYYLATPVERYDESWQFTTALANRREGESLYVLAPRKALPALEEQGAVEPLDESAPVGRHTAGENCVMLYRLRLGEERMATRP
jgi:4-amino-4-deoxy-L-arabinose transferase-like glycosyltransferase